MSLYFFVRTCERKNKIDSCQRKVSILQNRHFKKCLFCFCVIIASQVHYYNTKRLLMTITNATYSILQHIFRKVETTNKITNDKNEFSSLYAQTFSTANKIREEWTESAKEAYKKERGQKVQKGKILHHSIAIGLTESQGMQDAEKLAQWLEAKLGTKIYAVAIHNDEGYLKRKDGYRLVSGKNCFFDRKSGEYFFDANKTRKINMADYEIIKNRHAHIEFSGFRQDGSSLNHFDFESKKNDTKSRFLRLGTSTFRKAYHKQLEILGFKQESKEYEYNFDATKLKNTARKEFLFLLNKESYEPESLTEAEVKKLENYKMRTNFEARERAQENENLLKNADKQNKILQAENEYLKNANDTTQNILESFVNYKKLRDNEEKRLTDEKESLKNQNADLQAELESVKAEWLPKSEVKKIIKSEIESLKAEWLPKSVVKKIIEQERKAWIAEQGHTAEDYKELKALNKQQYSDIETLKSEIESLKQQLAQKPKEVAKEVVKEVIKEIPVKIPVKVKDTEHEQALEVKEQELKTIAHNLTARENDIKNKEAELKEKEKILNATIAQNKAIEDNTAKFRDEILIKDEKINKLESQEQKHKEIIESIKTENETLKEQLENKSLTELENIKTQMQKQLDTLKRELESADYYKNHYKNLLDDVLEKLDECYGRAESKNYEEATQEHLENIKRDIDKKEMQERNERKKSFNDKVEKLIAEQQNRAKSTETHQESKNDDEDDNIHRNH